MIYQDCPLNYLPIYVKGGQVFTMQSDITHTEEKPDGILSIHVYQGETGSEFTHYEDAGEGLNYMEGDFHQRKIHYKPEQQSLILEEATGSRKSDFHTIRLYFHGFESDSIHLNGEQQKLNSRNYAFLERLTEFDPLPEHNHPYFEITNLKILELPYTSEEIVITSLI